MLHQTLQSHVGTVVDVYDGTGMHHLHDCHIMPAAKMPHVPSDFINMCIYISLQAGSVSILCSLSDCEEAEETNIASLRGNPDQIGGI